jgi:hypothetical protein
MDAFLCVFEQVELQLAVKFALFGLFALGFHLLPNLEHPADF